MNQVSDLKMNELVPTNKDKSEGLKKIYRALLKHKQQELPTSINAESLNDNEMREAY
jgi:hypothetical protein